jgi:hypothetical protein
MPKQRTPEELQALGKKLKDGTATDAERLEILETVNAMLQNLNSILGKATK